MWNLWIGMLLTINMALDSSPSSSPTKTKKMRCLQIENFAKNELKGVPQSPNHEYVVEKIVGTRILDGEQQYLLKWKGYSHRQNTWEPLSNINCHGLVAKFEADRQQKILDEIRKQNGKNETKKRKWKKSELEDCSQTPDFKETGKKQRILKEKQAKVKKRLSKCYFKNFCKTGLKRKKYNEVKERNVLRAKKCAQETLRLKITKAIRGDKGAQTSFIVTSTPIEGNDLCKETDKSIKKSSIATSTPIAGDNSCEGSYKNKDTSSIVSTSRVAGNDSCKGNYNDINTSTIVTITPIARDDSCKRKSKHIQTSTIVTITPIARDGSKGNDKHISSTITVTAIGNDSCKRTTSLPVNNKPYLADHKEKLECIHQAMANKIKEHHRNVATMSVTENDQKCKQSKTNIILRCRYTKEDGAKAPNKSTKTYNTEPTNERETTNKPKNKSSDGRMSGTIKMRNKIKPGVGVRRKNIILNGRNVDNKIKARKRNVKTTSVTEVKKKCEQSKTNIMRCPSTKAENGKFPSNKTEKGNTVSSDDTSGDKIHGGIKVSNDRNPDVGKCHKNLSSSKVTGYKYEFRLDSGILINCNGGTNAAFVQSLTKPKEICKPNSIKSGENNAHSDRAFESSSLQKSVTKCEDKKQDTKTISAVEKVKRKRQSSKDLLDLYMKLQPESIVGVTKVSGKLVFLIKCKGRKEIELVPAKLGHKLCPQTVIQYYQSRLVWKNTIN